MKPPTEESPVILELRQPLRKTMLLPVADLPADYSVRMFQQGDQENWLKIWESADETDAFPSCFGIQFPFGKQLLPERMFFVLYKGEPVGTATAWMHLEPGYAGWGQVHSVPICKEHQGLGLGKYLTCTVINKLVELGYKDIYLETSEHRTKALQLYKSLGFTRRPHQ